MYAIAEDLLCWLHTPEGAECCCQVCFSMLYIGNMTSLLLSVPFIGFQYHVGFSTRSHLCVTAPFLKVVPGICQNYCINTHSLSRQLRSSSDSFMLCVPATNTKTFWERSFSFTGPTVLNSLPFDIHSKIPTLAFRQAPNTPFQQQVFCIQRNPAADLVTFLSSYIVHTLITCNFVILFWFWPHIYCHCKALGVPF